VFTQRVIGKSLVGLVLVVGVSGTGCQLERFFPQDVGKGAARLTVRNAAKLITIVDADTRCGFSSERVKQAYRQDGELGSLGTVTWSVENCEIDFGDELVLIGEDCNGEQTRVRGKLKVSATRTIEGLLTGNPEQPAIPQSPDAVSIDIAADVTDYEIRFNDKVTAVTLKSGHMDVSADVHLAQSASLGVCSVPASDVTLASVKVRDAVYTLDDDGHIFDVDVPQLDISAQIGKYNNVENRIDGNITVWDEKVDLSDDSTLDPDYTFETFRNSYACTEDLVVPATFECLPLTPKLADGAAKLTVNNVGNLISLVVADDRCGFASPSVMNSAVVTGEVGKEGGEVVYRIDTPCAIDLPLKTPVARDCLGKTTYADGKAYVKGTMRLRGRLSGDPLQPVIPTSRDPAEITFEASFESFKVSDDKTDQSLEIVQGTVTGRMQPRMAIDTLTGACSVASSVVTFSDLTYQPGAEAIVRAAGNALRIHIDGSSLDAQSGEKDGVENMLAGNITVDGATYGIPLDGDPILDPAYDPSSFDASWQCKPNMRVPASDEECNFHQVIGDGAARLVIQTVGTVASMVNADSDCGFEDKFGVLIFPTEVVGDTGEMGSMTWDVEGCTVGADQLAVQAEDCLGGATFVEGFADVNATRTVTGERTKQFLVIDAIEPRSSQSVTIELHDVALHDFVTYPLAAGESQPIGKLTIHDGTLSAVVEPATGARADEPETFDVPTPVARISSVRLQNAHATLEAQGKLFELTITDTDLSATNGSLGGVTNQIEGTITFDGDTIDVGGALNPTYNSATFDQSYMCTENLAGPVR
jgi:hypothetical protein